MECSTVIKSNKLLMHVTTWIEHALWSMHYDSIYQKSLIGHRSHIDGGRIIKRHWLLGLNFKLTFTYTQLCEEMWKKSLKWSLLDQRKYTYLSWHKEKSCVLQGHLKPETLKLADNSWASVFESWWVWVNWNVNKIF